VKLLVNLLYLTVGIGIGYSWEADENRDRRNRLTAVCLEAIRHVGDTSTEALKRVGEIKQ